MPQVTFVLSNALKGKTLALGGGGRFRFRDGKMTISGSEGDLKAIATFLERNWQAYPEGDERLTDGKRDSKEQPARDKSGIQPEGAGASEADGEEGGSVADTPEAAPQGGANGDGLAVDIQKAVMLFDKSNDSLWTSAGKPAVDAVSAALGVTVTRNQIDEALKG